MTKTILALLGLSLALQACATSGTKTSLSRSQSRFEFGDPPLVSRRLR